jgi:hypothetical protein
MASPFPLRDGDGESNVARLGMNNRMFVWGRTPVSLGASILDPGVKTCPPVGVDCAYPLPAESIATVAARSNRLSQRFPLCGQVAAVIRPLIRLAPGCLTATKKAREAPDTRDDIY